MVSSGKMTGSAATQRTKQMARAVPSATRKPVTRVAGGKKHSNTLYKEQERVKEDHGSKYSVFVSKQKLV